MKRQLEPWDIVRMESNKENFGLIYDINDKELLILCMTPEQISYSRSVKISSADLIEGNIPRDHFVITYKMLLIKPESITQKVGRIGVQKIDEILRQIAHNIVEKHYDAVHKKNQDFIPGKLRQGDLQKNLKKSSQNS